MFLLVAFATIEMLELLSKGPVIDNNTRSLEGIKVEYIQETNGQHSHLNHITITPTTPTHTPLIRIQPPEPKLQEPRDLSAPPPLAFPMVDGPAPPLGVKAALPPLADPVATLDTFALPTNASENVAVTTAPPEPVNTTVAVSIITGIPSIIVVCIAENALCGTVTVWPFVWNTCEEGVELRSGIVALPITTSLPGCVVGAKGSVEPARTRAVEPTERGVLFIVVEAPGANVWPFMMTPPLGAPWIGYSAIERGVWVWVGRAWGVPAITMAEGLMEMGVPEMVV